MKEVKIPRPEEPKRHQCKNFKLLREVGNGDRVYQCNHGKGLYWDAREKRFY